MPKSGQLKGEGANLALELVKELIDAGIHFGHRASRWNPKMKPYIFGKRNLIHIVNVKETLRGLLLARKFVTKVVSGGKDIIIVGTKRQARKSVQEHTEEVAMHCVTERWLGGTLTNFSEIRKRITRLDELEQLESEGMLDAYSKKEGSSLRRQMRKILRNLGGIRKMKALPGAMIVVDQRREINAIREAIKLKIPVICLIDTDSDPDLVDIPIPGNDDAMRGIDIIVREICEAVKQGIGGRQAKAEGDDKDQPRRRSKRDSTARAATAVTEEKPVEAAAEQKTETTEPVPAAPQPTETTTETTT